KQHYLAWMTTRRRIVGGDMYSTYTS
ncbi:unnamed protein product, partial [Allacma fusca]